MRFILVISVISTIPYVNQIPSGIYAKKSLKILLLAALEIEKDDDMINEQKADETKNERNVSFTNNDLHPNRIINNRLKFNQASVLNTGDDGESGPGWSQWSDWKCTVTCGGGTGKRVRICHNPNQGFCQGAAEEDGSCNEQLCPDILYTLSPETKSEADTKLKAYIPEYLKKEGQTALMSCNNNVLNSIRLEYPTVKISWLLNGMKIDTSETRYKVQESALEIQNLTPKDNGIYVCRADLALRTSQAVSMFVLSVQSPHPTQIVNENLPMTLQCNGIMLGRVLKNLNQKWIHNGSLYKDFYESSPLNQNDLHIDATVLSDNGRWECKITDRQSLKSWITNSLVVQIVPSQSLTEKASKHKNKIAMGIGGLVILLIVLIIFFKFFKSNETRQMERELKMLQEKKKRQQASKETEEIKLLQEVQPSKQEPVTMPEVLIPEPQISKPKLQILKSEPGNRKPEPEIIKPLGEKLTSSAQRNVANFLEQQFKEGIPFGAFEMNEYTLRMKYKD